LAFSDQTSLLPALEGEPTSYPGAGQCCKHDQRQGQNHI
jgi:hypothetical protein